MRVGELVIQARFADTRLAHHGHDLAAAGLRVVERLIQLLDLGVAADDRVSPRAAAAWSRVREALAPVSV